MVRRQEFGVGAPSCRGPRSWLRFLASYNNKKWQLLLLAIFMFWVSHKILCAKSNTEPNRLYSACTRRCASRSRLSRQFAHAPRPFAHAPRPVLSLADIQFLAISEPPQVLIQYLFTQQNLSKNERECMSGVILYVNKRLLRFDSRPKGSIWTKYYHLLQRCQHTIQ